MSATTKTNLTLDLIIFAAFLAASNPALTGLPIHEWLSVALIATFIIHLLFHWNWLVTLLKTFFKKLWHTSRLNFLVDSLLFLAMTLVMLSGVLISKSVLASFGIQFEADRAWRSLHSLSADASVLLVGLHFALHWKWVVNSLQRYLFAPLSGLVQRTSQPTPAQMTAQAVKIDQQ